ncbi:MAG: DUF3035 domain-containing protein [Alphaproteobacteria bacterium]|nr:DUF3035 domain-containing protein [Alphaproteobacteria bacterium]MBL6938010.1 DUF3035 domain-containing protein [Alphaproteobacteria bacterium]MBL7099165.1 DUF3035 domain-containing protein [Alphaproteobacteria bacterium]
MRRVVTLALIGGLAAGLGACDSLKSSAGFGKDSPDEFAVVTKAPLVIPPDFNLHPPAPGAAAANQVEPTQAAQSALFAADPATVAASLPANMSMGERYLLANARVQDADPGIRQQISADAGNLRGSDDSFTDSLLFSGSSSTPPGSLPVDADAEARRLEAARAAGATAAPPAPAGSATPAPSAPPPPPEKADDSPWYWPF